MTKSDAGVCVCVFVCVRTTLRARDSKNDGATERNVDGRPTEPPRLMKDPV